MKVLITGGAGYIGSVLTELLLVNNHNVTVIDSFMYNQISLLHVCNNKNFTLIDDNVMNYVNNKEFINGFDVIIPLAAIVGAPACDANKSLATEINFNQIKSIVNVLNKNQRLIMPNTNSQYGSSNNIITEESPFNPLSHYAITKCDAERYILNGSNGICLRLATAFGASPRMRTDLLVNDFVYRAVTDGFLILFESNFIRNYIHVRDIANTFLFCIENYEKMNNNVFNVGLSNANISKLELVNRIKKIIPELTVVETEFKQDMDKRNYIVSNEKLESHGWKAINSIEDGINELIKAYKMIIRHKNKNFTNL